MDEAHKVQQLYIVLHLQEINHVPLTHLCFWCGKSFYPLPCNLMPCATWGWRSMRKLEISCFLAMPLQDQICNAPLSFFKKEDFPPYIKDQGLTEAEYEAYKLSLLGTEIPLRFVDGTLPEVKTSLIHMYIIINMKYLWMRELTLSRMCALYMNLMDGSSVVFPSHQQATRTYEHARIGLVGAIQVSGIT